MPTGIGWWISPKGKVYEIHEHFSFVQEKPKLFGFTEREAETWDDDDRDDVLRKVVSRGWIRVRNLTYETWELTGDAIFNIVLHLKKTKAWPQDILNVSEVKRNRWMQERASFFLGGEALEIAANVRRKRRK